MTDAAPTSNIEQARRRRLRMADQANQDKLIRSLITPEGAALKLRLASAGERAGAFIIDFIILILTLIAGLLIIGYTAAELGYSGWNVATAIMSLFVFFLRNFYFVCFELGRRAATPGKRTLGLRVAARNGGRLTANAVFARNFVREVEVFMPLTFLIMTMGADDVNGWIALFGLLWSGVFLLFPIFNKDKLRAGDLIAGTWVIHAPKIALQKDILRAAGAASTTGQANPVFTPDQLNAYGIHELHVLENVLRKSNAKTLASVAERIKGKIKWTTSKPESDRTFLEAYYAALRKHLEQKLLMGKRKTDKFDQG